MELTHRCRASMQTPHFQDEQMLWTCFILELVMNDDLIVTTLLRGIRNGTGQESLRHPRTQNPKNKMVPGVIRLFVCLALISKLRSQGSYPSRYDETE